jgi:toxin YoeB
MVRGVMKYSIRYLDTGEEGLLKLKKSGDKQALKKLEALIGELKIHPETGTGHPERLKHRQGNQWSRHITHKHRLVYEIFENIVTVEIIQTYGHYGDK